LAGLVAEDLTTLAKPPNWTGEWFPERVVGEQEGKGVDRGSATKEKRWEGRDE